MKLIDLMKYKSKFIPLEVVKLDSRWLNEEETIVYIRNQLNRAGLKLRCQVTNLLRENRRDGQLITGFDDEGFAVEYNMRGNRNQFGLLKFYYVGARAKAIYWKSDIDRWLEEKVFPKCSPIEEAA